MSELAPESVFDDAAVVSLKPGDVVLYRVPGAINNAIRAHLVEMLEAVFPNNEIIILENGADVAVLRPEPGVLGKLFGRG